MERVPTIDRLSESQAELTKQLEAFEAARINPVDFRGVQGFTDEEIVEDVRKVEEKKARIKADFKPSSSEEALIHSDAKMVESILYSSIRESNWLGKGTNLIVPSHFDDLFRGTDAIAEFAADPKDPKHIGFVIDFTMTADTIAKKMQTNLEALSKGFVPTVKYFESPTLGKKKEVALPHVILGADYKSVKRVADNFLESTTGGRPSDTWQEDPLQYILLDEIRSQLRALRNVCYEMFNNKRAGAVYHRSLMEFVKILDEKGISDEMLAVKSRGDSVHGRLLSLIKAYDRPPKN